MKIELRRLTYSAALSQETAAFTADIWIDGQLAFHARNQGHGGCDFYHQVGPWTVIEVDAWLKTNRPPHVIRGISLEHDLEVEVGRLLDIELERRRVKRLFRTHLVTIERGQIYQYKLKGRTAAAIERAIKATNPDAIVLNGASDAILDQAIEILLAAADSESGTTASQ